MNTQLDKQQVESVDAAAASDNTDYFNFDQWASEVKRQMLESLQKKYIQREAKNREKKLKQRNRSDQS